MARLKGLDEFVSPAFIGRMQRVARRRALTWHGMVAVAAVVGAAVGLIIA